MDQQHEGVAPAADVLLEIIRTQTEIARAGLDLAGVMALVTERAQELTRASGAIVELAEGSEMVYRAASGMAAPQLGLRLQRDNSLSGLCVAEARILECKDSETDPRVDREACRKVGLRSMIVVPLRHLDHTVGVIKVVSPDAAAFGEDDIRVLQLMSDLIAASMFNAVRYETNELYHRATHDALTGLANRALFFDRLRQSLAQAKRYRERVGILNLDMDNLKPINDTLGHRAGDAALRELAQRVAGTCRQSDTVARTGGDEFGIILPRVAGREDVERQRMRLAERISAPPMVFDDRPLTLAASIGMAVFPDDAGELDALLELADKSMYETKRARRAGA